MNARWSSGGKSPLQAHRPPDPAPVEEPPQEPHPAPDEEPVPDHNPTT